VKRLVVAVFAAVATPVLAEPVALPVKLRDGAEWTQTSVHMRTDTRGGATRTSKATSVVRVTYAKDRSAQTLRLEFVSFDVEGADAEARRSLADQARLVYPAVLEVDDALTPTRVRDWDAMREKIFQALAATSTDPRAVEAAKGMFPTDAGQAAALFREQGLVALGQGADLEPGEAFTYDSSVPNILGGPPIKASGAFRLESVDGDRKRAIVTWTQTPDSASMAASIKVSLEAALARIAPDKQADFKAQFANMTLERQETCRHEIDVASGLATTADCNVEIKSGVPGQSAQRADRWIITQTLPEKR
jgi:hypothetical protein